MNSKKPRPIKEKLPLLNFIGINEEELVVLKGIYLNKSSEKIASILNTDKKHVAATIQELVKKGYAYYSGFWIFKSINLTKKGKEILEFFEKGKIVGVVKWFVGSKGYGFIISEGSGEEFFFHVRDVVGTDVPRNKDRVAFVPVKTRKGLRAIKVELIEKYESEDRIKCPACGKLTVPRLVIRDGEPEKSLCPFCGEIIRNF